MKGSEVFALTPLPERRSLLASSCQPRIYRIERPRVRLTTTEPRRCGPVGRSLTSCSPGLFFGVAVRTKRGTKN